MASSYVGGLSGAFIPVSEDQGMIDAVTEGALTLEKLEAMTCVCSVGLDMIALPGDTSAATLSGIIADEAAIGMVNNKTTAVRLIPAPGLKVGDTVDFGGLLGSVIPFSTEGLDFALTALFVVLFLGQLENAGSRIYGLIGTVCSLAVLLLAGADNMVIPSMIVILIVLLIGRKRI